MPLKLPLFLLISETTETVHLFKGSFASPKTEIKASNSAVEKNYLHMQNILLSEESITFTVTALEGQLGHVSALLQIIS